MGWELTGHRQGPLWSAGRNAQDLDRLSNAGLGFSRDWLLEGPT